MNNYPRTYISSRHFSLSFSPALSRTRGGSRFQDAEAGMSPAPQSPPSNLRQNDFVASGSLDFFIGRFCSLSVSTKTRRTHPPRKRKRRTKTEAERHDGAREHVARRKRSVTMRESVGFSFGIEMSAMNTTRIGGAVAISSRLLFSFTQSARKPSASRPKSSRQRFPDLAGPPQESAYI